MCSTNEEKIIDELMDNLFDAKPIKNNFKKFPALYLLENQKLKKFTEKMLHELILDQAGFLMRNKFQFILTDFNRVREKNQYWKKQFEELKQMLDLMNEELDELPLMPPPSDNIFHVRNVGTQVNMIPVIELRNIPEGTSMYLPPKIKSKLKQ